MEKRIGFLFAALVAAAPSTSPSTGSVITVTPGTGSTTPATSSSFTEQLQTTGNTGPVTFSQNASGQSPHLVLSPSTGVITTTGPLATGSYAISGVVYDQYGDSGTWTFTLTVGAGTITVTPTTGAVMNTPVSSFSTQLMASGGVGPYTFTQDSSGQCAGLTVNLATGAITAVTPMHTGTCTISGTVTDAYGDSSPWTFSLTISATPASTSGLILMGRIYFANGSAVLNAHDKAQLTLMVKKLKTYAISSLTMAGFASMVGTIAYNKKLSAERAAVVMKFIRAALTRAHDTLISYIVEGEGVTTRSKNLSQDRLVEVWLKKK